MPCIVPKLAAIGLLSMLLPSVGAAARSVIEYQAEKQDTSGVVIEPDRTFGTVAAEASGRQAVQLDALGQSIEIKLLAPANALTIRYSLSRSATGGRLPSTLSLLANGWALETVLLTSRYAFDLTPLPPHPARGGPLHRFWDEIRVKLAHRLAAGTILSLQMAPGSNPFAVDLVDAEQVPPPAAAPGGALSVLLFGADRGGTRDSASAFAQAVATAERSGRVLYVPPGRYHVDGHIVLDRVRVVGAGSWYSLVTGHQLGFYSLPTGSTRVSLQDLALESDVSDRRDELPLAAIGGRFSHSSFRNLYLHHAKVGIWLDGPARDLTICDVEIADQTADGINLHRGIRDARVKNNRIRSTGDDGIASWSEGIANSNVVIRGNRISAPSLANGIAIYGGNDITVDHNEIADVLIEGGGIHLGARFRSTPFSGRIRISRNRIIRSGAFDPNWHFGIGAIWVYALERPIKSDILFRDNQVVEPGCEALQLLGPKRIDGVRIDGLRVRRASSSLFAIQTAGTMHASRVLDDVTWPIMVRVPNDFRLTTGRGDRGWKTGAAAGHHSPQCI